MWGEYISAFLRIEINIIIVYFREEFAEFLVNKFFFRLYKLLKI